MQVHIQGCPVLASTLLFTGPGKNSTKLGAFKVLVLLATLEVAEARGIEPIELRPGRRQISSIVVLYVGCCMNDTCCKHAVSSLKDDLVDPVDIFHGLSVVKQPCHSQPWNSTVAMSSADLPNRQAIRQCMCRVAATRQKCMRSSLKQPEYGSFPRRRFLRRKLFALHSQNHCLLLLCLLLV